MAMILPSRWWSRGYRYIPVHVDLQVHVVHHQMLKHAHFASAFGLNVCLGEGKIWGLTQAHWMCLQVRTEDCCRWERTGTCACVWQFSRSTWTLTYGIQDRNTGNQATRSEESTCRTSKSQAQIITHVYCDYRPVDLARYTHACM